MPMVDPHNYSHDRKDVFISGSHADSDRLGLIGQRLLELGFSVFHTGFDLPAGMDYKSYIRHYLENSGTVLVCWSAKSVDSDYVNAEAQYAKDKRLLVACAIEPCHPLPPFNIFQTIDLAHWRGDAGDKGWRQLVELLAQRKTGATTPFVQHVAAKPNGATATARGRVRTAATILAIAAMLSLAVLSGWLLRGWW